MALTLLLAVWFIKDFHSFSLHVLCTWETMEELQVSDLSASTTKARNVYFQ